MNATTSPMLQRWLQAIMTHPKNQIICFLLTTFVFLSCGQNADNTTDTNYKFTIDTVSTSAVVKSDTTEKVVENDTAYVRLVALVEKEFFKNLKDIDRDFGESNFTRFSKILKKHHKTVYDLYLELSEIKRNAVSVARANGVEIRANGKERILNNYYYYLEKEMTAGKSDFQNKYGFDNRLMQCFENNYCFCYERKEAVYCDGGDCKLINGEFWKHH